MVRTSNPSQHPNYSLLLVDITSTAVPFLRLLLQPSVHQISRLIQLSNTTQRDGSYISVWSGEG